MSRLQWLLGLIICGNSLFAQAQTITDNVVKDLACSELKTEEDVFKYINPNRAFSAYYHLPISNWSFGIGDKMAACWSLSHAQRIIFYLGRYYNLEITTSSDEATKALNMFRGEQPQERFTGGREGRWIVTQTKVSEFQIFSMKESALWDSMLRAKSETDTFWSHLISPFKTKLPHAGVVTRKFKSDIEAYQMNRFFRFNNLGMGLGSGTGTASENQALVAKLSAQIDQHQIPMVNLRYSRLKQHVIILKSYSVAQNGDVFFNAYDSNQPFNSQAYLMYDATAGKFRAPSINLESKSSDPIAVFSVDDEDLKTIQKTLFKYYSKLCAQQSQ